MFEYIIGKVESIQADYLVLENQEIGYKIYTSANSLAKIKIEDKVKMHIYYNLRDDGVFLYGFYDEEELNMFNLLILVSKIGPRNAINLLSTLTPNQIKVAIINNDNDTLCRAPGVGKKTASRIILELKDKINKDDIVNVEEGLSKIDDDMEAALEALMSFGYNRSEIMYVLKKVDTNNMTIESIIRQGLIGLSKQ